MEVRAIFAVGAAEKGDYSKLIERLNDPDIKLEMIERKFLAKHLVPEASNRPTDEEVMSREMSHPKGWKIRSVVCLYQWMTRVDEDWRNVEKKYLIIDEICRLTELSKNTVRKYIDYTGNEKISALPQLMLTVDLKSIAQAATGKLSPEELEEIKKSVVPQLFYDSLPKK